VAVLQLAASISKLSKLSFFKRPAHGYIFAFTVILGALCWFFLSKNRAVQGVEGVEAFLLLGGAAILAFLATASLSSLIHRKTVPLDEEPRSQEEPGLDALRTMTYLQAISRFLGQRKQE